MVKKITSGQVVERRKSYVGRKPSRRGARIKGNSGEKKQENNRESSVILNLQFTKNGETGETVRLHCHIVINSAGLRMEDRTFTLYGEPLDDTWGRGTVDVQLLRDQKDYYPLALYLIRQARNIPDGKKYTSSRNMEKPKVEYTYVLTPTQLRVPAGATTLPGTRYEPELGVNFVRYIPREKDPARKIGGRKEMAVACAREEGEEAEA